MTNDDSMVPLKVLIIDPDGATSRALEQSLARLDVVISVRTVESLTAAKTACQEDDVNTIYLDLIGLDIDPASNFVFATREVRSGVVFVLYHDVAIQNQMGRYFYDGERQRFRHYFTLDKKEVHAADFDDQVAYTVRLCQDDLAFTLTREKIEELQKELEEIDRDESKKTVEVSFEILKQIQDQLAERAKQTKRPSSSFESAEFLGIRAEEPTDARVFLAMPYSEVWSAGVEIIVRKVCAELGIEFTIAKQMDGRYVAQDIWKGITGATVVVADLTGANANVTYEIGLADAIGKEVLLLCQEKDVPFDFLGHRLVLYENTMMGSVNLTNDLNDILGRMTKTDGAIEHTD